MTSTSQELAGKKNLPGNGGFGSAPTSTLFSSETSHRKGFRVPPKPKASENGQIVLSVINKVISSCFPDIKERMNSLSESRKRVGYSMAELVLAGVMLFVFKKGSRNKMDNARRNQKFKKNYCRIFKLRLPSMDAVEDVYRNLEPIELENLIASLISTLIEKRVLHRFRLFGQWFVVAVDATGIHSDHEKRWEECVHKTSKKGIVTYMNIILEAKLTTSNGICISLCSEPITNPVDQEYDKQDCESKAFKRLAIKLKKYFPRLPICLVFDGLYCNQPVMEICNQNDWSWIVVFKEGNLPSVHQELNLLPGKAFGHLEKVVPWEKKIKRSKFTWCDELEYRGIEVNWIKLEEAILKHGKIVDSHVFEYLTCIGANKETCEECVRAGRQRWKIEDSFNDQKNRDFEMQHLFSRRNYKSFYNWYLTLQIAFIIYIIAVKENEIQTLLHKHSKETIENLWDELHYSMVNADTERFMKELDQWIELPRQIRLCK